MNICKALCLPSRASLGLCLQCECTRAGDVKPEVGFSTANIAIHGHSLLGKLCKNCASFSANYKAQVTCIIGGSGNLTDESNSFRDCSRVARIRHVHRDNAALYLKAVTMSCGGPVCGSRSTNLEPTTDMRPFMLSWCQDAVDFRPVPVMRGQQRDRGICTDERRFTTVSRLLKFDPAYTTRYVRLEQ